MAQLQHADIDDQLKSLANELLSHNPLQQPLLSDTHGEFKLKQKLGGSVEEREAVKRRCVQPVSQVVSQDAQVSQLPTPAASPIFREDWTVKEPYMPNVPVTLSGFLE